MPLFENHQCQISLQTRPCCSCTIFNYLNVLAHVLQHHSFNGDDSRFLAQMGLQCSGCSAVDAAVSTMAGGVSWKKRVAQKLCEVYPVASFDSALPWVAQSSHAASVILCLAPSYSLKRPAQFSPEQISLQDRRT